MIEEEDRQEEEEDEAVEEREEDQEKIMAESEDVLFRVDESSESGNVGKKPKRGKERLKQDPVQEQVRVKENFLSLRHITGSYVWTLRFVCVFFFSACSQG